MNQIIWQDLNLSSRLDGIVENEDDLDEELEGEEVVQNLVTSPFGLLRVDDYFNPMKQYNWHMAHVNFNLTKGIIELVSRANGVEKILPVSRYRFLIAIGIVFQTKKVKEDIEKLLNCTPMLSQEVTDKQKDLQQIYDKWAIYYKNTDKWDYCTEDDYDSKIIEFQSLQQKDGGILITHENMFQ